MDVLESGAVKNHCQWLPNHADGEPQGRVPKEECSRARRQHTRLLAEEVLCEGNHDYLHQHAEEGEGAVQLKGHGHGNLMKNSRNNKNRHIGEWARHACMHGTGEPQALLHLVAIPLHTVNHS